MCRAIENLTLSQATFQITEGRNFYSVPPLAVPLPPLTISLALSRVFSVIPLSPSSLCNFLNFATTHSMFGLMSSTYFPHLSLCYLFLYRILLSSALYMVNSMRQFVQIEPKARNKFSLNWLIDILVSFASIRTAWELLAVLQINQLELLALFQVLYASVVPLVSHVYYIYSSSNIRFEALSLAAINAVWGSPRLEHLPGCPLLGNSQCPPCGLCPLVFVFFGATPRRHIHQNSL